MTADELPELDIDADAIAGQSAAAKLEQMASGGSVLVGLATNRLRDALSALEEGRFSDAERLAGEAMAKIHPLSNFEATMGAFGGRVRIIRAHEVTEGMMLTGLGRVSELEWYDCDHHAGSDHKHLRVTFEDGDKAEYTSQREVFVTLPEDDGDEN